MNAGFLNHQQYLSTHLFDLLDEFHALQLFTRKLHNAIANINGLCRMFRIPLGKHTFRIAVSESGHDIIWMICPRLFGGWKKKSEKNILPIVVQNGDESRWMESVRHHPKNQVQVVSKIPNGFLNHQTGWFHECMDTSVLLTGSGDSYAIFTPISILTMNFHEKWNLHSLKPTGRLKTGLPKRKVVFQPSIFRGKLAVGVFGGVYSLAAGAEDMKTPRKGQQKPLDFLAPPL